MCAIGVNHENHIGWLKNCNSIRNDGSYFYKINSEKLTELGTLNDQND